jgi:hypothetical protein
VIKYKSHIAPLLLCLFVFPILFQPVHVLLHHSNKNNTAGHHCCSHETCQASIKHEQNVGYSVSKAGDKCAICDYHFATKDFIDVKVVLAAIPLDKYDYNTLAKQQKYLSALRNKSPRAPPAPIL